MSLAEKNTQFAADVDIAHQIVHGDASTTVTTAGGPVRSLAKLVADEESRIQAQAPALADLANNANQSKGAALVGFIQSLAGAIGRTVAAKLREYLTPTDFGADATGATDSTVAMNAATSLAKDLNAPTGTYTSTNTVSFGSASYRAGRAASHSSSGVLFAYRLNSGAQIEGGSYATTGGVAFDVAANASGAAIRNAVINDTSASNATAVNVNATGVQNFRVHGSTISANGFGVLTNGGGTVDGMIVSENDITAGADPIELNAPSVSHQNIAILGNILRANGAGASHATGFAVGIAGSKNTAVVGNAIGQSTWEAIHVEDRQDTVSVVGNVGQNLHGDFFRAGNGGLGGIGGGGIPVVGNNAKSYAAGLGNYGAYLVFDASGAVPGMTLVGNRFTGFDGGIIGGSADLIASGNVLESCGVAAIRSDGGGYIYGTNLARNTPTLVKTARGTVVGRVVSETVPTAILDTSSHAANTIGSLMEDGFAFRGLATAVAGSGNTVQNLFALPQLMRGRIILRAKQNGGSYYFYASADISWNGTTLTVSNQLYKAFGTVAWSGQTFTATGGQLQVQFFKSDAGAMNFVTDVIFKGEFYN